MSRLTSAKDFTYSDRPKGWHLAAQVRKASTRLGEAERAAFFKQGMQIIYGGAPKTTVRTGP